MQIKAGRTKMCSAQAKGRNSPSLFHWISERTHGFTALPALARRLLKKRLS